jgi:hypothetical protein
LGQGCPKWETEEGGGVWRFLKYVPRGRLLHSRHLRGTPRGICKL